MANVTESELVWRNGKFVRWKDATVHALSHVVHYGSAVFEGLRCYTTPQGPAIFRLIEHMRRLRDSALIYRMELPYTPEQLADACVESVARNKLSSCYLRPLALRGYGPVGVDGSTAPIEVFIFTWPWGAYLGEEALTQGVDVCISSWNRPAPNTHPAMSKAAGNYLNSQLMRMEANINGYAEAIALDARGLVSEGSGENLFLVRDGSIYTPPLSTSILPGITRDTIVQLARERGYAILEQEIPREALYIADELFFVGTAVEVTPIRSVDRIKVGKGSRGPVTRELQDAYLSLVTGKTTDPNGWLRTVPTD